MKSFSIASNTAVYADNLFNYSFGNISEINLSNATNVVCLMDNFYFHEIPDFFTIKLPKAVYVNNLCEDCYSYQEGYENDLTIEIESAVEALYLCKNSGFFNKIYIKGDKLEKLSNGFSNCYSLKYFDGYLPKIKTLDYTFQGSKNLEDFMIELPNLTDGRGAFYNCYNLTKESVLRILNSLPEISNGNIGFQNVNCLQPANIDDELGEAVANAVTKGWTVLI